MHNYKSVNDLEQTTRVIRGPLSSEDFPATHYACLKTSLIWAGQVRLDEPTSPQSNNFHKSTFASKME